METSVGIWSRIQGNLVALPNFYELIAETPNQYKRVTSFGVEVLKIERWQSPQGHAHIAASIGWERSHREGISGYRIGEPKPAHLIVA